MALIVRCLLTVVSVVTRQFWSLSIYLFMPKLIIKIVATRCQIWRLKNAPNYLRGLLLRGGKWGEEKGDRKGMEGIRKIGTYWKQTSFTYIQNFNYQSGHISPQSCISPVPSRHPFVIYRHTVPTRITKCTKSPKNAPNSISAGALAQTPQGELTALPRPPSWI